MKQPRALISLSLTEMWERFGIYFIEGLLIFYMTKALNFPDAQAYAVLGEFTALIYISPSIGGLCADRLLGFRHTILLGAYLLFIGYIIMALPFFSKETTMLLGLAVVVIGTGFLKPSVSSFLGEFYQADDSRRDAGFTLYYMIFNFGILMATSSSGYIQRLLGWKACFGVAAFGFILAIYFFRRGYRHYGEAGLPLQPLSKVWLSLTFIILAGAAICYQLLKASDIGNLVLVIFGVLTLAGVVYVAFRLDPLARKKMLALIVLIIISVVFWGIYFQIFLVANLFIDRNVDRLVLGHSVPPTAFIALEPLFLFLLSPLFILLWKKLHERGWTTSRGLQFTAGLLLIGVALQVLVIAISSSAGNQLIHPFWIVICYVLITASELTLSPIGLSMVTQLAPPKWVGFMMGIWFLGLGYGGLLAGYLGKKASIPAEWLHNLAHTNAIYSHAFQSYAWLGFAAAILTLALTPWLNRLTKQPKGVNS